MAICTKPVLERESATSCFNSAESSRVLHAAGFGLLRLLKTSWYSVYSRAGSSSRCRHFPSARSSANHASCPGRQSCSLLRPHPQRSSKMTIFSPVASLAVTTGRWLALSRRGDGQEPHRSLCSSSLHSRILASNALDSIFTPSRSCTHLTQCARPSLRLNSSSERLILISLRFAATSAPCDAYF